MSRSPKGKFVQKRDWASLGISRVVPVHLDTRSLIAKRPHCKIFLLLLYSAHLTLVTFLANATPPLLFPHPAKKSILSLLKTARKSCCALTSSLRDYRSTTRFLLQARTDRFEKGKSSAGNVRQYLSQIEIVSNNLKYFEHLRMCILHGARCLLYSEHKCAADPSKFLRPSIYYSVSSPTLMRLKYTLHRENVSGGN